MAATSTEGLSLPTQVSDAQSLTMYPHRRRRVDPDSGRALEILGHAIEYLADELLHGNGLILAQDPKVEAIQLLMGLNRQVYLACREVQTLGQRCRSILHLRSA